jgi:hypothetical protein
MGVNMRSVKLRHSIIDGEFGGKKSGSPFESHLKQATAQNISEMHERDTMIARAWTTVSCHEHYI